MLVIARFDGKLVEVEGTYEEIEDLKGSGTLEVYPEPEDEIAWSAGEDLYEATISNGTLGSLTLKQTAADWNQELVLLRA